MGHLAASNTKTYVSENSQNGGHSSARHPDTISKKLKMVVTREVFEPLRSDFSKNGDPPKHVDLTGFAAPTEQRVTG